jgi:DNA polymerase V
MKLASHSHLCMPIALSLIEAGPGSHIDEDYELLDINTLITNGKEGFVCFEVTGDSMVELIPPESLIFVDLRAVPRNGDIIAVSVNGRTNVKILEQNLQGLYLVSSNEDHPPVQIRQEDHFQILGVVKAHLHFHS